MKNENDVRKIVKRWFGEGVLWVEHKSGATAGLPDALVMIDGALVPLELKHEACWDPDGMNGPGVWVVNMRPSQLKVMRRIVSRGGKYFVLVGSGNPDEGLGVVRFCKDHEHCRNGYWVKIVPITKKDSLLEIVRGA